MLPQTPVSAVDCVGPAIEWTKRAMFRPFRWGKWWRVALVGMLAGELQSVSCNIPGGGGGPRTGPSGVGSPFPGLDPAVIASIIAVLVVGGIALLLVHMYLASVSRFILFDAVTTGRYRVREGWSRWHERGLRWFGFQLALMLVVGMILAVLVLPFIGVLARIKDMGVGAAVGSLFILVPIFMVLGVVIAVVYVLAKDFAVPMVALENEGVFRAFWRVLRMARTNLGDYAGYIGLKLVLTIAYAICFSIASFIILMMVIVPVVIGAVAAGISAPNLFRNPAMLAILITVFVVGVFVLMFLIACIFAPAIFFFQAYVYTWYAQRYEPLWNLLYPAPPPPPAPVEPIVAPEPPPLPAV